MILLNDCSMEPYERSDWLTVFTCDSLVGLAGSFTSLVARMALMAEPIDWLSGDDFPYCASTAFLIDDSNFSIEVLEPRYATCRATIALLYCCVIFANNAFVVVMLPISVVTLAIVSCERGGA